MHYRRSQWSFLISVCYYSQFMLTFISILNIKIKTLYVVQWIPLGLWDIYFVHTQSHENRMRKRERERQRKSHIISDIELFLDHKMKRRRSCRDNVNVMYNSLRWLFYEVSLSFSCVFLFSISVRFILCFFVVQFQIVQYDHLLDRWRLIYLFTSWLYLLQLKYSLSLFTSFESLFSLVFIVKYRVSKWIFGLEFSKILMKYIWWHFWCNAWKGTKAKK